MAGLNERIRKARTDPHLSQEYVANFLGIGRSSVVEMESGKRSVKAEELEKLSDLFLIPVEVLLKGTQTAIPSQMFARGFDQLDEADQQEILNLIEFKRAMKARAWKLAVDYVGLAADGMSAEGCSACIADRCWPLLQCFLTL